jgi:hypothetical protein
MKQEPYEALAMHLQSSTPAFPVSHRLSSTFHLITFDALEYPFWSIQLHQSIHTILQLIHFSIPPVMRPGRLPRDLHRAGVPSNDRGLALSFAICLILGPAIFLSILAYEGSIAEDPSPFDDDPVHHPRGLAQNGPLRFCAYLDEENHIQATPGPCNGSDITGTHQTHKAAVTRDFCVEESSYGSFDIISCSDTTIPQLGPWRYSRAEETKGGRNPAGDVTSHDEDKDLDILGRRHASTNGLCDTARPGGSWEPCSKPKDIRQARKVLRSVQGFCVILGTDGSSTDVLNSTCSAAKFGDGEPAKCNQSESVSAAGKQEQFACYLRSINGAPEVFRCSEATKSPGDNFSYPDDPNDRVPSRIVVHSNATSQCVDCDNPDTIFGEGETLPFVTENATSNTLLPHELEPMPPHLPDRAILPRDNKSETLADEPEKWISTNRCTKDFCAWVKIPGQIKSRCYAKDDKNPKTPPMPDAALKYAAPYECNLCLEEGKHHEDTEQIEQHCHKVIAHEELVVKIVAGAVGGILLLCALAAVIHEHRRKKHELEKRLPTSIKHPRKRNGQTFVMPAYDGSAELPLSLSSITASQRDAPEINVVSPTQSGMSERGSKIPVMPPAARSWERIYEAYERAEELGHLPGNRPGFNPQSDLPISPADASSVSDIEQI